MKLAGWCAIAAAILTVTGLVTLIAFFESGSPALGALNDLNTILLVLATVPVALALFPYAARTSRGWAAAGVAADVVGAALAAVFSALLVLGVMSFEATLLPVTFGNGLIGVWLIITAGLLLGRQIVSGRLGWLGVAGGLGLAISSIGFPLLGPDHPLIALAGLVALVGLVGFYAGIGWQMLRGRLAIDASGLD